MKMTEWFVWMHTDDCYNVTRFMMLMLVIILAVRFMDVPRKGLKFRHFQRKILTLISGARSTRLKLCGQRRVSAVVISMSSTF